MLPNIYTAIDLCEFEHQERLRVAAQDRLAASAQRGGPSSFARVRTAFHGAVSWLSGQTRRLAANSGRVGPLPWPGPRRWLADRRAMNAVQGSWVLVFTGLRARRDQTVH
jgi:hypothetical protein